MKKIIFLSAVILFFPTALFARHIERPIVRIVNSSDFEIEKEFYPFSEDSKVRGLNIASADLNADGEKEIIVAAGRDGKPLVKIFNRQGELLSEFLSYAPSFNKGLKPATADLYNDGLPEIITAPGRGGGPHIRIFNNSGSAYFGFFAFDKNLRGGANVSAGDVNGDGQKEIIVGAGYDMEPIVKIFDNYGKYITEFLAYEKTYKNGVNILAVDLDNDGQEEIITAPDAGRKPEVKVFDYKGNLIKKFMAYSPGFGGGVNLAKSDVDQDGSEEILTGAGFSGGAHLRIFNNQGEAKINPKLFAFKNFKGGISIAGEDLDNDGKTELLAGTQTISPFDKYQSYKIIDVNLKKQKLYAYFKGALEKEYWISSGTWKFPTPKGNFKIYSKVPLTRMSWQYGPDHPDNYDLPDVPWVLAFYGAYTIHGTYWHHNFGYPMSHGCVNMSIPQAKMVYDWADIGTPVNIYYKDAELASVD